MKACATGQHIKTATLTARKAGKGQQEYLTFKFQDVLDQLVPDGRVQGGRSPDRFRVVQLAKLEVEYKPQKADGTLGSPLQFKYDLKANKTF